MAVFRDAGDGVEAADSIKERLRGFPWPEGLPVGLAVVIHSGRWSGNPRKPGAGTALYRLNRFAKIAQSGQVVVTYSTAALLEDDPRYSRLRNLGEVELPDLMSLCMRTNSSIRASTSRPCATPSPAVRVCCRQDRKSLLL